MAASPVRRLADPWPRLAGSRCTPRHRLQNRLGEGAFWDRNGERLLWVDILAAEVFVEHGQGYETFALPVMPSAIWKVSDDRVYLATEEGVGELTLHDGRYRTLALVEADRPDTRSNDGAMAPDGSFWFGTMLHEPVRKGGALYRVAPDFSVRRIYAPVGIPNTFLFPAGPDCALIGDTFDRRIDRYELRGGEADRVGTWMQKDDAVPGDPDGSVLAGDSAVINAEWDGARLVAYDMQGRAYDSLGLPVSRPTSCALGGGDGRVLYVTSARDGLTPAQLAREPLAGSVLAVHLD